MWLVHVLKLHQDQFSAFPGTQLRHFPGSGLTRDSPGEPVFCDRSRKFLQTSHMMSLCGYDIGVTLGSILELGLVLFKTNDLAFLTLPSMSDTRRTRGGLQVGGSGLKRRGKERLRTALWRVTDAQTPPGALCSPVSWDTRGRA